MVTLPPVRALGFDDVKQLLSMFVYKPNWTLEVKPPSTAYEVGLIQVMFFAPDSRRHNYAPIEEYRDSYDRYDSWAGPPLRMLSRQQYFKQNLPLICVYSAFSVPIILNEQEFWPWLRLKLREVEDHEMDEFFKVNGVAIYDPHSAQAIEREFA